MDPHEIKPPGPGTITNSTTNAGSIGQHGQQHQLGGSGEQLNLPPPSPQAIGSAGINGATGSLTSSVPSASISRSSNANNDGDSDTESLASMSAKAKAAAAAEQNHTASATNGHNCGTSTTVNNLNVNAKQQRQQKRRRERAQRLQAERENRFANSVNNIPNSGLLYHASSAGSMGEDSNNSNGNFTSSSNGSNNVMPPTDSIASLLLNPPHSPECNSGLMATPSDSEGESLDEDLLSTSSSSTLLLPRDKPPPRPPPPVRRKLPRSPVLEEEIIDGFAILEFKSYEDLEFAIKLGQKRKEKRLSALEELTSTYSIEETKMPKIIDTGQPHPIRGSSALNLPINNIKDNSNNMRLLSSNNNNINCHPAQTVTSSTSVTVQDTPMDAITPPWKSQYQNSNNNNNVGSLITNSNQNINNCSSVSGNIISNTSNNTAASTTMIISHNGNNSNNSNNNSDGAGSSSSSSSSGIAETTSSNINNTDEDAVMTSVDVADDCRSVLTAMDSGASCCSSSMTVTVNNKIDVISTPKEDAATNLVKNTAVTDTTTTSAVSAPSCTLSAAPQISPVTVNASPVLSEKVSIGSGLGINTLQVNQAQAGMVPVQISEGYRNSMLLDGVKIGSSSGNSNKRSLDVAFGTNSGSSSKPSNHFMSMASNAPNHTQLGNTNNNSSGEMTTDMRGLGSTTASASATVPTVTSASQQSTPKIVQSTPTKDEMFDRIRDAGVTCKSIGMGLNICDNDENKGSERLGPIVFPSTPTQHIANAAPSPTTPRKSSDYPQQATAGISIKSESNDSFPAPIAASALASVGSATVGGGGGGGLAHVGIGSSVPGTSPPGFAQPHKDNVSLAKNSSQTTHSHTADGMPPVSARVLSPMVQPAAAAAAAAASTSGSVVAPVHTVTITNDKSTSSGVQQQHHIHQQQHHHHHQHQHQQLLPPQPQQQHQQQQPSVAGVQPNLPPPLSAPSTQVSTEPRNFVPSSPAAQLIDSPFASKLASNTVGAHLVPPPINTSSIHCKNMPPAHGGNSVQSSVAPISMISGPITSTVTSAPVIGGIGVASRLGSGPPMHHLPSGFASVQSAPNSAVGIKPIEVTATTDVPKSIAAPPPPPSVMNGFLPGFMPGNASGPNNIRITPHMSGHMVPVTSAVPPISIVPIPATSTTTAPTTGIPSGSSANATNATISLPVNVAASTSSASMTPVTMSSMPKGPYMVSTTTSSSIPSSASVSVAPSHGLFVQGNPAISIPGGPPMLGGVPNGMAPMLIHSPYRTPYPGYPLYAPYSGLPHSPYLPPAVPSPNASPRTIDTRSGREITPIAPSPKVIAAGMRPVTPVTSSTAVSTTSVSSSGGTTIPAPPPTATLSSVPMPMMGLPPGSTLNLPPGQSTHLLHHLPYGANPHGPPQPIPSGVGFQMGIVVPNSSHSYSGSSSSSNSSGINTNTTTTATTANATALSSNSNNNSGPHSSGSSVPISIANTTIPIQRSDTSHLLPPPPPHMLSHPNLQQPPSHVSGVAVGQHMSPMPHMLMHPQHGMLRGISPSTTSTNSCSASALPLIGGPTSSSVIQRVISPKSENPSREREIAYSIPRSAPSINTHSSGCNSTSTGAPPYMTTAVSNNSSVGSAMPVPYSSAVSTLHTMHSHPTTTMASPHQHIATPPSLPYPPKNTLWPSSSLQLTPSTTTTPSSSSSSSLATRPTPPPAPSQSSLNTSTSVTSNAAAAAASMPANSASSQTTHATAGVAAQFQPSFFITPLPPPPPTVSASSTSSSSSTMPSSSMTVSSGTGTLVGPGPSAVVGGGTTSSSSASSTQTTVTTATSTPVTTSAPHPFSAESLFQTSKNDQADLLRRELDSRFLDRSGLAVQPPAPPPPSTYLRQELHHHQHQHTHLHQHQQLIPAALPTALPAAPPPAPAPIFPQLFKDIPKIAAVETPFYRTGIGLPGYPGYNSGLLHPGLGGATPFMPPGHLTTFAPKKTGRWNAMHVRIAWEIYYNQNKQNPDKLANTQMSVAGASPVGVSPGGAPTSLSATGPSPSSSVTLSSLKTSPALSMSSASPHMLHRPGELPPGAMAAYAGALPGRSPFETSPLSTSFIGAPPSHIGTSVSPFGRYAAPFGFGLSHFGCETWRPLQRTVAYHPGAASAPMWPLKNDPALDNARREAEEREREREMRDREQRERERQRREREERERKEKEEKIKREQQERERERERERDRKERERREIERRELERERMLQQQRINESNKLSQAAAAAAAMNSTQRDRSPHRNINDPLGGPSGGEIRIKEEHPRTKDEQDAMLMRASAAAVAGDPRYHQSIAVAQASAAAAAHHASFMAGRHGPHAVGPPPPPHLARTMMPTSLGGPPITHFGPPGPPGWPMDPYRDPYAPMVRYNILEALRHEEERHKVLSMYAAQSAAHLRGKEPSPIPPPIVGGPLGPPPPPPHHRIQQSSHHQQPGGVQPQPTIIGKPQTLGGMPHPITVDTHHTTKKEDGSPNVGVGVSGMQTAPSPSAQGR